MKCNSLTFIIFILTFYCSTLKSQTDSIIEKQTYRLVILKGSKDSIFSEEKNFIKIYPEIKTYITFEQPYFILAAGTCTDIEKAKKLKELIEDAYREAIIEKCE